MLLRLRAGGITKDLDSVGTPHFAQFVPLEDRQVGFFTVYDGDFDTYIADFTKNIGEVFDLLFKFTKGAPPSPCRKHLQEFIDFAKGANREPIGFYQAYPGLSVQDIHALIADQQAGVEAVAEVGNTALSHETMENPAKTPGGFLHGLFDEERRQRAMPLRPASSLDLPDIQGLILRGYRMPMVGISCSKSAILPRRANFSADSSAAMKPTRRRSPRQKIGMWVSHRGQTTIQQPCRAASLTTA